MVDLAGSPSVDEHLDDDPLLLRHRSPAAAAFEQQQRLSSSRIPHHEVPQPPDAGSGKYTANCIQAILNGIAKIGEERGPLSLFKNIGQQYRTGYQQYSRTKFRQDFLAGCTVAIMAIPLSMSYAKLAGLPAYYGLYASFVPPAVFPTIATSRQLAVGPAALVCLVLSTGLTAIVEKEMGTSTVDKESDEYVARYTTLAIQCSFLAGILYVAMGLCKLGFVTQFLSRALISGFTSGAAVIIAVSQLKYVFGLSEVQGSDRLQELVKSLVEHMDQFNWKTFVLGVMSAMVVLGCKKASYKFPKYSWVQALGPFVVAIASIALTAGLDLDQKGVPTVANIPAGLPSVTVHWWTPLSMDLWAIVLSIVVVGFVQAFAISKRFAYKHGYELDSSQELLALGMANFVGSVFQCFPVTGCLGQSAVNDSVGAQTGVASCVTAVFVMIVLLFLTPVFEKMPLAGLGGIVIAYVIGMFDYEEAIYLYRVDKFDFSVWVVAFLCTCFLGVKYGLGVAVAVSLLIVVYEAVYPHTSVLGRLRGTSLYRNVKQYPDLERYDGLVIVRINTPIFFANAVSVRDKVRKYKRMAEEELESRNAGKVCYIILDISPVSHIDTTALHVIQDMYETQKKIGTQICFCNPSISVMEKLVKGGIFDLVGREHFFSSDISAVQWCLTELEHHDGTGEAVESPPDIGTVEGVRVSVLANGSFDENLRVNCKL